MAPLKISQKKTVLKQGKRLLNQGKSATFAIFLGAIKSIGERRTYALICVGIVVSDPSFAIFVENSLRVLTNFRGIEEHIQAKNVSCALNATRNL